MAEEGSVRIPVDVDDKEAERHLSKLRRDMERTKQAIEQTQGKESGIAKQLQEASAQADATRKKIEQLREAMADNEAALNFNQTGAAVDPTEYAELVETQRQFRQECADAEKALASQERVVSRLGNQHQRVTQQLQQQNEQLERQEGEYGQISAQVIRASSGGLGRARALAEDASVSIRKGMKSILKYGLGIRSLYVLTRRLAAGIKEGFQAFLQQDPETRAAVNDLKASLNALKLSWGAAFAPIVTAVAPLLQTLIGWLQKAAEAVSQFLAVLSGKNTYKRAVANANSVTDSMNAAGGAAKEAKKQVMGFDELNKLDGNDSGGGGGGGGSYLGDLEEVEVSPAMQNTVTWLKDHFSDILAVAGAIGAAILAWKISRAFNVGLKKTVGICMAVAGAVLLVKGYFSAWTKGVDWTNLTEILLGVGLIAGGLALAFGETAAAVSLLIGGIAMLVLGFKEWITTGELSTETFVLIEAGIAAVGVALALLTGSWIPLVIAAVAAIVVAVIKYWDKIEGALAAAWEWIKSIASAAWAWFHDSVIQPIADAFSNAWATIKNGAVSAWNGVKSVFSAVGSFFKETFEKAWKGVVRVFSVAGEIFVDIRDGILTAFKAIVNALIRGINTVVAIPFNAINSILQAIHDVSILGVRPFTWVGTIGVPQIPYLAKGGVLKRGQVGLLEGDGAEAVVPLEQNTGWIDKIADSLLTKVSRRDYASAMAGVPLPAMAMGTVVPPRALSRSGSAFSEEDIDRLISGLRAFFPIGGGSGSVPAIHLYLDGRELYSVTAKYQRQDERRRGG